MRVYVCIVRWPVTVKRLASQLIVAVIGMDNMLFPGCHLVVVPNHVADIYRSDIIEKVYLALSGQ